jgi:hypothetical protein
MALPPLLPSNTPRFRVNYTASNHNHSFQIRSGASPAAIGTHITTFLTTMTSLLFQLVVVDVEWAPAGSDVFNPVVTGAEGHVTGAGTPSAPTLEPLAINFIGRTSGGRRVRRAIFGAMGGGTNYRYTPGENANVDNAINVLQAAGSMLQGIDGLTPIWHNYANVKYFDHWVREVR